MLGLYYFYFGELQRRTFPARRRLPPRPYTIFPPFIGATSQNRLSSALSVSSAVRHARRGGDVLRRGAEQDKKAEGQKKAATNVRGKKLL